MTRESTNYKLNQTIMITPTTESFVSAILIRRSSIQYELTYLDDKEQKTSWFDEKLIDRIEFNSNSDVES